MEKEEGGFLWVKFRVFYSTQDCGGRIWTVFSIKKNEDEICEKKKHENRPLLRKYCVTK